MATDVEALLIDELGPHADPAKVSTRTLPDAEFVRVLRVGGAVVDRVLERATVVLEGWALTETAALELLERCRDHLLHGLSGRRGPGVIVYAVEELAGPGNLPPDQGEHHRYTLTAEIRLRRRRSRPAADA